MNDELKDMLQSVIEEALKPVHKDLQSLRTEVQGLKSDVQTLKSDVQTLKSDVQTLKSDMEMLKSGQDELQQITRAIRDRQEETDARLEALSMDIHQLHGKMEAQAQEMRTFRRESSSNFRKIAGHLRMIDHDLDETIERVAVLEQRA